MEGRFNGGFFCVTGLGGLYLEGLEHGRACFLNFTVFTRKLTNPNLLYKFCIDTLNDHTKISLENRRFFSRFSGELDTADTGHARAPFPVGRVWRSSLASRLPSLA